MLMVEATPSAPTQFRLEPDILRAMVTPLTSASIWVLDITRPFTPDLLFGYALVPANSVGSTLSYGLYLSLQTDSPRDLFVVEPSQLLRVDWNLNKIP
jgi:hypothetical protein